MNAADRRFACVVLAAIATPATAATGKADICHWDANRARVSSVATSAVESHFAQHGDSYPSQYFRDSDGDGFGDPTELTDRCPNVGYVANNTDCNDADASLSPNATEVRGDGIDNDCDPLTLDDEACHESGSSGGVDSIEANFTDLSENICNIAWHPGEDREFTEDSRFANPSTTSGGQPVVEVWYRTVLGAENPESPEATQYDWSATWEWISEAGEHVSAGGYGNGAAWESLAGFGIRPGDYAVLCTGTPTDFLPSGNWTLWATVVDHEKGTTVTTCNPSIFTVP